MRTRLPRLTTLLLALCCCTLALAQEPQGQVALDPTTVQALERLADQIDRLRRLPTPTDDERTELQRLRWQFAQLASQLNVQEFEQPSKARFDLMAELEELLRPAIHELKGLTARSREKAALAARMERATQRRELVATARQRLEATRDALPEGSPARREIELELTTHWQPLLDQLQSEILVVGARLRQLEQTQVGFWDSITGGVREFLKSRGLTLVLSALVFLLVYFGLRLLTNVIVRRRGRRNFSTRVAAVLLRVLTILVAVAATVVVPFARDDWLLLAIAILFLLGVGWALVKAAPAFLEQFRLLLNIGAVREGERIVIDGLPYSVERLSYYSRLHNPLLTGGTLRVPLRDLIHARSRPAGADEPWFPCRQGDVVALDNGVVGQVQVQSPEVVMVAVRRDAPRNYPTEAFLRLHPRNLSHGFELRVPFGVDYRHQPDVLDSLPRALETTLREGLADDPGEALRNVRVELAAIGDSSLDLVALVDFDGSAALRYHELKRRIHQLLVAGCNRHGFTIPFPQLTVHGATVHGAE